MRVFPVLLLLLAACGGDADPGAEQRLPAEGVTRVVVRALSGDVELSTTAGDSFLLVVPRDTEVDVKGVTLRIEGRRKGTMRIAAPPGRDLTAAVRKAGGIGVEGSWGKISLEVAKGDIRVDAQALDGARVRCAKGNVEFALAAPPTASIECEALAGDIAMRVTPTYRGSLLLKSGAGKIDLKRHPEIRVHFGPGNRMARAFVGKPFTEAEHAEIPVDKRPAIWADATNGAVNFELTAGG